MKKFLALLSIVSLLSFSPSQAWYDRYNFGFDVNEYSNQESAAEVTPAADVAANLSQELAPVVEQSAAQVEPVALEAAVEEQAIVVEPAVEQSLRNLTAEVEKTAEVTNLAAVQCAGVTISAVNNAAGVVTVTSNVVLPVGSIFYLTGFDTPIGAYSSHVTLTAPSNNAVFSNLCSGRYEAVVIDGTGCFSNSSIVVVNNPAIVSLTVTPATPSVCVGQPATFTASVISPANGDHYINWWVNNVNTPIIGTGPVFSFVPTASPTTVFAQATLKGTCCTSSIVPSTVAINQPPTCCIRGNTNICVGTPLDLTVVPSGNGPFQFQWSLNGVDLPNQTLATLHINPPVTAGTYCVRVTDINGCVDTCCVCVTVTNPARITLEDICVRCGDRLVLTAHVAGGTPPFTFFFVSPNGEITTNTTGTLVIDSARKSDAGRWCVIVVDANGCIAQACACVKVKQPKDCKKDGRKNHRGISIDADEDEE